MTQFSQEMTPHTSMEPVAPWCLQAWLRWDKGTGTPGCDLVSLWCNNVSEVNTNMKALKKMVAVMANIN